MEMKELRDHAYTSTGKSSPADFTYKMSYKEVEDFVKLRVSNGFLFSGKRNASMWAWRAILKYMGLQHRMSHYQASKKWENMKKKFKDLKNAPDGAKGFSETWPYFSLMEDALEGRLQGKAPVLKVLPSDSCSDDFLPFARSKKKKKLPTAEVSPARDSEAGRAEVRVREGDGKEVESVEGNDEMDFSVPEAEEEEEKSGKDREVMLMLRERAVLERERAVLERERAVLEKEKLLMEKDRDALRVEWVALEKEKVKLEKVKLEKLGGAGERRREAAGGGGSTDARQRLMCLLERVIDKL